MCVCVGGWGGERERVGRERDRVHACMCVCERERVGRERERETERQTDRQTQRETGCMHV